MIRKTFKAEIKQIDTANFTVEAYVSTRDVDRDREVILPTAWVLDKYNGIVIDSHNYDTVENGIGKVVNLYTDDTGLKAVIKYFVGQGNETADWAWVLVMNGLASFSVGFIPIESIPGDQDVKKIYTKVELLEISQVLVPANPYAVQDDKRDFLIKMFEEVRHMKTKGVIPYHDYGIVEDENYEWDASAEVRDATPEDLKKMCAWYDEQNPDVKSAYKLPHQRSSDFKAVWRGVAAAMAALLGARGGVKIPDEDREGVYEHLAKHYKQFGKEPPELHKTYANDEEILKACLIGEDVVKYGRVLSEANKQKIKTVVEKLKELQQILEELLSLESVEENSASVEAIKDAEEVLKILKQLNSSWR